MKDEKLASLQSGVAMIQQQLKNALTETGLEEIDATGKLFDPALHEAVSQQESAEVTEGHVLQQIRKGYQIERPSVARRPPSLSPSHRLAPVKDDTALNAGVTRSVSASPFNPNL